MQLSEEYRESAYTQKPAADHKRIAQIFQ